MLVSYASDIVVRLPFPQPFDCIIMRRSTLLKAKPEYVVRLAKWLRLHIDGMSAHQIAKLVYWRITRSGINRH